MATMTLPRLLQRFSLLIDLSYAFKAALLPTIKRIFHEPSLLFHPRTLSHIFMFHIWTFFGPLIDEHSGTEKAKVITPYAYGVVLDVGAGHGHNIKYLDRARVTKYVALEPNVLMHPGIQHTANAAGLSEAEGNLVILACGAEDTTSILTSLGGYQPVDTIVSTLTLCSVPEPQRTIKSLVSEVLKPSGELLFYEHVQNPHPHAARWQRFWSPLWSAVFDGCRLDRPTHMWVQEIGRWEKAEVWTQDGEGEDHLFLHRSGRFVKSA
ncbi:hypothetical protein EDC04DRAFT_392780 [Pisolithus marmoratus]|nr:hypothetical protein EDC04DRAFT_392780 [Pisolithus marmoratus]